MTVCSRVSISLYAVSMGSGLIGRDHRPFGIVLETPSRIYRLIFCTTDQSRGEVFSGCIFQNAGDETLGGSAADVGESNRKSEPGVIEDFHKAIFEALTFMSAFDLGLNQSQRTVRFCWNKRGSIEAKASKVGQPCGITFVGFALVRTTIKDSRIDEDWMQISFFKVTERRLPENAGALHKDCRRSQKSTIR